MANPGGSCQALEHPAHNGIHLGSSQPAALAGLGHDLGRLGHITDLDLPQLVDELTRVQAIMAQRNAEQLKGAKQLGPGRHAAATIRDTVEGWNACEDVTVRRAAVEHVGVETEELAVEDAKNRVVNDAGLIGNWWDVSAGSTDDDHARNRSDYSR